MKATVMLPTFWTNDSGPERLGNLKLVIQALYKQTELDFELVAVVDGPEGNPTVKYLEGAKKRARFLVQVISRPREGVRIASARNLALQAARAPVLIGIQDNLSVGPGFVDAHLRCHDNEEMGLAGPVFVIGLACRDADDLKTDHRYERGFCKGKEWFDAWARNFSVSAAAVQAVGGYDTTFDGGWGHEDVELAYRLQQNGVAFIYGTWPAIVGTYLVNQEIPRTPESLRGQAAKFYKKHGFWI